MLEERVLPEEVEISADRRLLEGSQVAAAVREARAVPNDEDEEESRESDREGEGDPS